MGIAWGRQEKLEHYIATMGYRKGKTPMVKTKQFLDKKDFDIFADRDPDIPTVKISEAKRWIVHSMFIGDSEDPYIAAAAPLYDWERTEQGQYIMEKAIEQPEFRCEIDHARMGYNVVIYAYLKDVDMTYYFLKYPNKD